MPVSAREIGTLIVVVLKARNLPNKRHIGKQAPYCLLTHNEDKRRTRVIKRGGQHPEWDEEFRFTILEDAETEVPNFAQGGDTPPPLPPKRLKGPKKIKGGSFMKLQCYADDARDPDFIGEALVDLTEALTKGETDEWFTLMNKDKYAGEIYLELTFWSNEPPPEKKYPRKSTISNRSYGGPGSFVPTDGSAQPGSDIPSTSSQGVLGDGEVNHLNSLPLSLRTSRPPLYAPHYEQRNQVSSGTVDHLTDDFAELGMMDSRRRESYPPSSNTLRPSASTGPNSRHSHSPHSQTSGPGNVYDDMTTPTSAAALACLPQHYTPYENSSVSGYSRNTGPRHSLPLLSSGYIPVSSPAPVSYEGMSTYSSDPSGFTILRDHSIPPPPSLHPPPPSNFHSQFHHRPQTSFVTAPTTSTTLATTNVLNAAPHHVHSVTPPHLHTYQQYPHPPEQAIQFPSSVPQEFVDEPLGPVSLPAPLTHSTLPQMRSRHASVTPSPPREYSSLGPVHTPPTSTGSRPLPQPGQSRRDRRMSLAATTFTSNSSVPPPVPQYHRVPSAQSVPHLPPPPQELLNPRTPSLPNPELHGRANGPPARPALPQPPVGPHSASVKYQTPPQLPPPPNIPLHGQLSPLPSSSFGNNTYFPSRPPQLHANYGQNLPHPPLPAEWQ
ncbi:hypothetical protein V8B97DRAFT_1924793 [Scleroderma yunnanense]